MTDEQLRDYLPSYGDRLAVFGYCRRKENEPRSRKMKVFERLRGKLSRSKGDHVPEREHHTIPNNAQKNQRKIEIGWMHFRERGFVQVRTKKGGGTRKKSVSKESKKENLLEKALHLFFPDGKNAEGTLTDFDIDLTDFQQHSLDDTITVGELYEKTKLPLLGFYLTTKKQDIHLEEEDSDATTEGENTHVRSDNHHSSPAEATDVEINTPDIIFVGNSTVFTDARSESVSLLYTTVDPTDLRSFPEHETLLNLDVLEDSDIVTFPTQSVYVSEYSSLDDTLPQEPPLPPSTDIGQEQARQREGLKKIVVLHRGQILKELIQVFLEERIMEDNLYFQQKAVDDGGVLRDVLSEFWNDFYEQCTLGNVFKVPYLRHDFREQEWESVG
nr:uncharacterized protein LOC109989612 [Labrus bergylta]